MQSHDKRHMFSTPKHLLSHTSINKSTGLTSSRVAAACRCWRVVCVTNGPGMRFRWKPGGNWSRFFIANLCEPDVSFYFLLSSNWVRNRNRRLSFQKPIDSVAILKNNLLTFLLTNISLPSPPGWKFT